jgi:hypothetical protein
VRVEILEWNSGQAHPTLVDLKDFGNVQTRLTARRYGESLAERHRDLVQRLLGDALHHVDVVPDASGSFLSFRVLGLEVARIEGTLSPRIFFGLEGNYRKLRKDAWSEFRDFLRCVLEVRRARSENPSHEFYRLQPERWLESLALRDITKIDPALSPDYVYPQVPAFSGLARGVIDILSITRAGRLAVIELKLHEEINLPLQGLDYWLRVKWLQQQSQFQSLGYFPGAELAQAPPILYLVSPTFRFHSTTDRIIRYLDPSIEVVRVGLNDQWREGVKVLLRRSLRRASTETSTAEIE